MKNLTEEAARLAILAAEGNLTIAAAGLAISRRQLWQCVTREPLLVELLEDLRETLLDTAETMLHEALLAGKSWAICFMLRTAKGRNFQKLAKKKRKSKKADAEAPDLTRLNPEQLEKFQRLQTIAGGNGDTVPEPDFCRRLDEMGNLNDGVRAALASGAGNLGSAAQKLGVTREELVEYLTRRPAVLGTAGDAREEVVDHAESALRAALAEKKPWAIRFVLKTLGRSRGYSEYENSSRQSAPSAPMGQMDLSRLTDEELAAWERLNEIVASQAKATPKAATAPKPEPAPVVQPTPTPAAPPTPAAKDEQAVPVVQPTLRASEDACSTGNEANASDASKLPDVSAIHADVSQQIEVGRIGNPSYFIVGRIANPSYAPRSSGQNESPDDPEIVVTKEASGDQSGPGRPP